MNETRNREPMSPIVTAEAFEIEAALVSPYRLTEGTLVKTSAVMLKLTDADGVTGWGEANPNTTFEGYSIGDAMRALQELFLPVVLGSNAPEPGTIDHQLDGLADGQLCAKGAVTMALLDILGHRLNVPAATLLGGPIRDSLPVLWPLNNGTAAEDFRVVDERAAQGYLSFMMKMGTSPIRDEVARVAAFEARYGSRIKLVVDANQGWSFEQAREFLTGVSGSNLIYVEQPVRRSDFDSMAALAEESALSISADESIITSADARELAQRKAADIFSIKSSKNGGPLRSQRIAAVAEAFGMRCYMNSMIEFGITQAASLQHAVTVRNLVDLGHAFMSTLRIAEDPTDFSTFVRNGTVHFPREAGLGIRVDEPHVRRLAVASFQLRAQS